LVQILAREGCCVCAATNACLASKWAVWLMFLGSMKILKACCWLCCVKFWSSSQVALNDLSSCWLSDRKFVPVNCSRWTTEAEC
jgi:hypothetical protein